MVYHCNEFRKVVHGHVESIRVVHLWHEQAVGERQPIAKHKRTVADELLKPTRIYATEVARLRGSDVWSSVHGIAHITGGGLEENVTRLLSPEAVESGTTLDIDWDAWETPIVFQWLQHLGDIATDEMRRVFNMGVGLVIVVQADAVDAVQESLNGEAFVIGHVQ